MAVTNKPRCQLWSSRSRSRIFLPPMSSLRASGNITKGKHPDLRDGPTLTHTASGIPGDPLNICARRFGRRHHPRHDGRRPGIRRPLTFRSSVTDRRSIRFSKDRTMKLRSAVCISSGEKRTLLLRSQSAAARKSGIMCAFGGQRRWMKAERSGSARPPMTSG